MRRHLPGIGLSYVQTLDDGMYHACYQDEQGSTAFITGDGGAVENSYVYDAFGNVLERKEEIRNDILYRGQKYDQEAGQYYLRARYYNPVIGRFIQEDTYRGDGLNLYAYCGNNPVMYYDPSGHNQISQPAVEPEGSPTTGRSGREFKGENNEGAGSWEAQTPRTGEEWNQYFQATYGAENVKWKARSFEHIIENPQTLYGSTQSEIAQILGDGWTADSYGNSGTGWKFINDAHPDLMVFYHNADGVHGGAYYGFSSGSTGTVKLVGDDYIPLPGDNAIILQMH